MKSVVQHVHWDGPCPFLTCLEPGPHDYPVCPDCGTIRNGNINCRTCVSTWPDHWESKRIILERMDQEAMNRER